MILRLLILLGRLSVRVLFFLLCLWLRENERPEILPISSSPFDGRP